MISEVNWQEVNVFSLWWLTVSIWDWKRRRRGAYLSYSQAGRTCLQMDRQTDRQTDSTVRSAAQQFNPLVSCYTALSFCLCLSLFLSVSLFLSISLSFRLCLSLFPSMSLSLLPLSLSLNICFLPLTLSCSSLSLFLLLFFLFLSQLKWIQSACLCVLTVRRRRMLSG